jgi:hypothetical protein
MKWKYFFCAALFAGTLLIVKGAPAIPVLSGVALAAAMNWLLGRTSIHRGV